MSITAAELSGGIYHVCEQCKEGKYESNEMLDSLATSQDIKDFILHHSKHGGTSLMIATGFLSQNLKDGYIDVDHPDLEPLILKIPGDDHEVRTGLQPTGIAGAAEVQRILRGQYRTTKSSGNLGERPTLQPRQPTIKDMQVTLPWSVKYSQDFRMNPEAHKDFRHALIHVGKAAGKLFAIIDDFDHRRSSEEDHRVKDYLADLVICAMRAANTHPGGVIDLMQAVTDRVVDKNFTNVKEVVDEPIE